MRTPMQNIQRPKAMMLGMAAGEYRCPDHPSVGMVMLCRRCRQTFETHTAKIAQLLATEPR